MYLRAYHYALFFKIKITPILIFITNACNNNHSYYLQLFANF